jgi:hypothetical protein
MLHVVANQTEVVANFVVQRFLKAKIDPQQLPNHQPFVLDAMVDHESHCDFSKYLSYYLPSSEGLGSCPCLVQLLPLLGIEIN